MNMYQRIQKITPNSDPATICALVWDNNKSLSNMSCQKLNAEIRNAAKLAVNDPEYAAQMVQEHLYDIARMMREKEYNEKNKENGSV